MAELLFWPALVAYGEAAVAYFGATRSSARLATWGVRVGWLVQTALLAVQAARADGFPWSTWAGSLNLFVWLVIGAYLIWGCRPRFRLVGLAVAPLAFALFALAQLDGRAVVRDADENEPHEKCVTCSPSRTTTTSAKPTSARYAARRPRRPPNARSAT